MKNMELECLKMLKAELSLVGISHDLNKTPKQEIYRWKYTTNTKFRMPNLMSGRNGISLIQRAQE